MTSTRKLRFAIFGNTYQPKKSVSVRKVLACLNERKAEVQMERDFYEFLTDGQQLSIAFIWLSDRHLPSKEVGARMVTLLKRIAAQGR
jgi:NAD+ kinase